MSTGYKYGYQKASEVPKDTKKSPRAEAFGEAWRFFVKPPEGADDPQIQECVFVDGDDPIFTLREHSIKLNGKYVTFPCIQGMNPDEDCPFCEAADEDRNLRVQVYDAKCRTLIDMTGYYSTKESKQVTNIKKMLVVKGDINKRIDGYARRYKGLQYTRWEISRTSDKDDNIGNEWHFVEKLTEAQMKELFPGKAGEVLMTPIDYLTHSSLKLRTHEELTKLLRRFRGETGAEKPADRPARQSRPASEPAKGAPADEGSVERGDTGTPDDGDDIPF